MPQPWDAMRQHLAERPTWEVACGDETHSAPLLYQKQVADEVSRPDAGVVLDDCLHLLHSRGVMALLEQASGSGIPRAMVSSVHYVWR